MKVCCERQNNTVSLISRSVDWPWRIPRYLTTRKCWRFGITGRNWEYYPVWNRLTRWQVNIRQWQITCMSPTTGPKMTWNTSMTGVPWSCWGRELIASVVAWNSIGVVWVLWIQSGKPAIVRWWLIITRRQSVRITIPVIVSISTSCHSNGWWILSNWKHRKAWLFPRVARFRITWLCDCMVNTWIFWELLPNLSTGQKIVRNSLPCVTSWVLTSPGGAN